MEQNELIAELVESLAEQNKVARKKGLERFKKDAFQQKAGILFVFKETFKLLVKSLSDESERCREISAQILSQFSAKLSPEEFEQCLQYLIPTMKQRIGLETSEEVRLELLAIVQSMIEKTVSIDVHISDIFTFLQCCFQDPNPTLQLQCCSLVSSFATNYPEKFKFHANSLVDPLLPLVSHHQQKIRAAGTNCLGRVVLHGGDLEKVYPVVSSRLLDESPKVRMEVGKVAFLWLKDHPDQDYWVPRLLPLALPLLQDENEDIRKLSRDSWNSIGVKWSNEHEENMTSSKPESEEFSEGDMMAPSQGCCNLVNKYQKIIYPSIYKELNDWISGKRFLGIKLLFIVLCHVKDHAEVHLEEILACLLTAAKDDERTCVELARKCSSVLGYHLPSQNYSDMLLESLKSESSENKLVVLGGFLQESKNINAPVLTNIAGVLAQEDICHSRSEPYQKEFLRCINSLVLRADSSISLNILVALLTLAGLAANEEVDNLARSGIDDLCKQLNIDRETLFRREISPILSIFRKESLCWTASSTSMHVFQAVLEEAGAALSNEIEVILQIFKNGFALNIVEVRITLYSILDKLLATSDLTLNSNKRFYPYILCVAADLIQPALVWHTGLSEKAIRSSATTCLFHLAQLAGQVPDLAGQLARQVWHHVLALMEDEDEQVRFWICRTASVLVRYMENVAVVNSIKYLIDRLDDAKKHVRAEALKALVIICDMDIGKEQTMKLRAILQKNSKDEEACFMTSC
eukprot:GFUD01004879.1.p1 GENE.GFUD01004879.1~~GFUD01004879.1.p1  ORF type:complete len:763 (-),score=154.23 GFUD01004879.1:213-2462(-)